MRSYHEKNRKRLGFEELESRDLLTSTPLLSGSQLDLLTSVIGSPPAEIGTPGTGFVLGLPIGGSLGSLSIGLGLVAPQFDAVFGALETSEFSSDTEPSNTLGGLAGLRPRVSATAPLVSGGPNATEAVGQMTISTGANTLGMNAMPISGFSSGTGGTGGPATGTQSEKSDNNTEPQGDGRLGDMNSSTGSVKTGVTVGGENNVPIQ